MKKIILIIATIMIINSELSAQSIAINGFAFTGDNKGAFPVACASIYFYDYHDQSKLEYVAFTGFHGGYYLGVIPIKDYHIEIFAPGFEKKVKNIGNLPSNFEGNFTLHFAMKPNGKASLNPSYKIMPAEFNSNASKITELLVSLKGFKTDEFMNMMNEDEGYVKIHINGYPVLFNEFESIDKDIQLSHIKEIEYYDISDFDGSLFAGVLNIVLNEGNKADKLPFVPYETNHYDL